ncbi:MAG: PQQ-like beta-propeller repeat protein [Caldisericia bacterium]|nr:PQQ-like beta-propeller repeat protein [Caldisericia bacterium]
MFDKNRLQIVSTLLVVSIIMISTAIVYGSEDKKLGFYTFGSNFQRTSFVETNNERNSFGKNRVKDLSISLEDYLNFGTDQWIIQDVDSLYFYMDSAIVKINKETLEISKKKEINKESDSKNKKIFYSDLAYSEELDVLVSCYFQKPDGTILLLNPDTLEEIQSVNGFGFSTGSKQIGVIVWGDKIIYLDYVDNFYQVKSLKIGGTPEVIFSSYSEQISSASIYKDSLYLVTQKTLDKNFQHSLKCIDLKTSDVLWEHKYSRINKRTRKMLYPVCTSNGVILEYSEDRTIFVDFFDLETGSLIWNSHITNTIFPSTIWQTKIITADNEQICLNIKAYEPWDMEFVSKIVIMSQKDGAIQREYIITKDIEQMVQVNKNLLLTVKDGKWIASLDTNSGQIKTRRYMKEGSVLSNIVLDKNRMWCLISKEDGNIALLEMK